MQAYRCDVCLEFCRSAYDFGGYLARTTLGRIIGRSGIKKYHLCHECYTALHSVLCIAIKTLREKEG